MNKKLLSTKLLTVGLAVATAMSLGACGSIEAWLSILMMNEGWFHPTLNLQTVDPLCAPLDYIQGAGRAIDAAYVMSNNFAFGGINSSLIFRKLEGHA